MEPLDYLKILPRHWKLAVALVAVALVLTFTLSPSSAANLYEATHVLGREQASSDEEGASAADDVADVAARATGDEVLRRAAEALGDEATPGELAEDVDAVADRTRRTVQITATADDPDRAVTVANAVADELVAVLDETGAARRQDDAAVAAQEEQLRQQIAELAPRIAAGGPDATVAQAESDALAAQLGTLGAGPADGGTRYVSLARPTEGAARRGPATGATRGPRLLLAGLVAAILAFGVAVIRDRSDQRLRTRRHAEREFGLPVLAEVPLLPARARHRAAVWAYEHDPRIADAYRGLRSALRDRRPGGLPTGDLPRVVVVTSPGTGDGKSTTAANLARACAEGGQRVLLIQWDLWRPLPARVLGAEDAPGVSELLEPDGEPLPAVVQDTSVPGLRLVAAGRIGHQPPPDVRPGAARPLLEEARTLVDVVVVDTAPILTADATRELVAAADAVVLACRAGRTGSPAARRAAELLEQLGAPVLGVVLVGVPTGPPADDHGIPTTAARR